MELAVLRVLAAFAIPFTLCRLWHFVKFFCDKT
jgi:hypothetical protein